MKEGSSTAVMALAMAIFGTIGLVRRFIDLPSATVALARAALGLLFLLLFMAVRRQKPDIPAIKRHLPPLLLSGALLGLNWVLLFEAYRYTSVAVATLAYYMAPLFLLLAAPLAFGERLTAKKLACVLVALLGMAMAGGVFTAGGLSGTAPLGILLGLAAAVMYAVIVIVNKRVAAVPPVDRTAMQFLVSVLVLLPYVLVVDGLPKTAPDPRSLWLLLVAGVVHTGIAYLMYFGSVGRIKASTVALFSYLDPVLAVVLSFTVLREPCTSWHIIGAVLVLGAAFLGEWQPKKKDGQ